MSWTSEFEPSPPRPNLEPDDFSGHGFEVVGLDGEEEPPAADGDQEGETAGAERPVDEAEAGDDPFDEGGSLDPSIFDGLFDDLGDDPAPAGSYSDFDLEVEVGVEVELEVEVDAAEDDEDAAVVESENGLSDDPDLRLLDEQHLATQVLAAGSVAEEQHDAEHPVPDYVHSEDLDADHLQPEPQPEPLQPEPLQPEPLQPEPLEPVLLESEQLEPEYFESEEPYESEQYESEQFESEQFESSGHQEGEAFQGRGPEAFDDQDGGLPTSITLDPAITPFDSGTNGDAPYNESVDDHQLASSDTMFLETPKPGEAPNPGTGLFDPMVDQRAMPQQYPRYAEVDQHHADQRVYADAHEAQQHPDQAAARPVNFQPPAKSRRWPAFAIATVVGALLGIGGALLLFQLIQISDGSESETATQTPQGPTQSTAGPASTTQDADEVAAGTEDPAATTRISLTNLAATGRFELHTITFVPGTTELTEPSTVLLDEVAEVLINQPDQPVSVSVRTFSESTPVANLELSGRQGQAIVEHLLAKDAPIASLLVHGLGAARIDQSQPVQNFVVLNTDLGASELQTTLDSMSPFAIGIDPVTNQLRPESIEPLNELGEALTSDPSATVSLAAYSYGEPDEVRNRELAKVAAVAAAAFLVANYEIDRQRVSTLAPGQALYATGAKVGNHVSLQWGEAAGVTNQLARLTAGEVVFGPGSAFLTPETESVLDRLIAILGDTELTAVIQVHVATEANAEENLRLSDLQAQVIVEYLTGNGLLEQQVRAYGGGNLRQFQGADQANIIVVTALP